MPCPLGGKHNWNGEVPCSTCINMGSPLEPSESHQDRLQSSLREGMISNLSNPKIQPRRNKRHKTKRSKLNADGNLSEATIQKAIVTWLRANGYFVWRTNQAPLAIYGPAGEFKGWKGTPNVGIPDLLFLIPPNGRLGMCEVKSAKGKTSPEQERWLAKGREMGALTVIARSVEDVKNTLTKESNLSTTTVEE